MTTAAPAAMPSLIIGQKCSCAELERTDGGPMIDVRGLWGKSASFEVRSVLIPMWDWKFGRNMGLTS